MLPLEDFGGFFIWVSFGMNINLCTIFFSVVICLRSHPNFRHIDWTLQVMLTLMLIYVLVLYIHDFDLRPLCWCRGESLVSYTHCFYLVFFSYMIYRSWRGNPLKLKEESSLRKWHVLLRMSLHKVFFSVFWSRSLFKDNPSFMCVHDTKLFIYEFIGRGMNNR